MFEDSLIESGGKLKTKRGWTSIISFLIQFMIIGVMVLIPLIFTEALPKSIQLGFLVAYQDWRIEKGKRPVGMPVAKAK